jgi:hypothetical protein
MPNRRVYRGFHATGHKYICANLNTNELLMLFLFLVHYLGLYPTVTEVIF